MKLNYANMRFRPLGTIIRLNIEHRTSNAEYGTLCIIDFKKGDHPDDVIRKTKNFEGQNSLYSGFYKLTEFTIRCWTFDVRCSMFSSFFLDQTGRLRPDAPIVQMGFCLNRG